MIKNQTIYNGISLVERMHKCKKNVAHVVTGDWKEGRHSYLWERWQLVFTPAVVHTKHTKPSTLAQHDSLPPLEYYGGYVLIFFLITPTPTFTCLTLSSHSPPSLKTPLRLNPPYHHLNPSLPFPSLLRRQGEAATNTCQSAAALLRLSGILSGNREGEKELFSLCSNVAGYDHHYLVITITLLQPFLP